MLVQTLQPCLLGPTWPGSRIGKGTWAHKVLHAAPAMRQPALSAQAWLDRSMRARAVTCAAIAEDVEEQEQASTSSSGVVEFLEELGLPMPDKHHQRKLDIKAIKALRTTANTAAKEKKLVYAHVGQNGITQSFLASAMDVLQKHEFVRIKLGDGSGLERRITAKALEQLLDAVCVHQIGYTITMYRQPGLPRPSNCCLSRTEEAGPADVVGGGDGGDAAATAAGKLAASATVEDAAVDGGKKAGKAGKGGKPAKAAVAKRPPEFEVL